MLDIARFSKPIWFEFSEDEKYFISFCTDEKVLMAFKDQDVDAESVVDVALGNIKSIMPLLIDHVVDWDGVNDGENKWPCTNKNKEVLFNALMDRASFCWRKMKSKKDFFGGVEEMEKN